MQIKDNRPEALIFDLDGTLFRTETLSLPAYHATFDQLRAEGLFLEETPAEEKFLKSLGLLLSEIWENVMPNGSQAARDRANQLLLHHQSKLLKQGLGEMYPDVATTLEKLHDRGYKLYVASNGLEQYVKEVIQEKGLAPLFAGLYSAGEFQTQSKIDLVRLLLEQHHLQSAWMCGDRSSDVEAGKANGLFVVGCNYGGFHQAEELRHADLLLSLFGELDKYLA
ncbi:HAD hydrolase-like protein [Alicyclobacillus fodiniaquatilis]|uniref:HAD hydrolase-like protein n=1 Tax=Alicyclobacillus fodiniaquatilis TaxID=1661150 RepID=A0ABW4JPZ5_9BACL